MRRPLPNLPRKPILSSCHKIAQPEELDNWAVWLRTCFKKHFHCSSRREEAQKFGSFIRDQTLLTSAATILKHGLKASAVMSTSEQNRPSTAPGGYFATTHWTVIIAAGQEASPLAHEALETLCRTYWYP